MNHDIIETAAAAGNFKTLASALREADLVNTLKGTGPYTVFAPTDEAFAKLPKAEIESLLKDKEKLKGILLFHVLPGSYPSSDVEKMRDGAKVKTVSGKEFTVGRKDDVMTVNGATVSKTDLPASNGVIRAIDTVIRPN
ncbi:MAG: fasciclin domain-containing protein [Actinobacteria bacterium]|nr:fasciclin domain-containing protein [Actinomycetota bacterium]